MNKVKLTSVVIRMAAVALAVMMLFVMQGCGEDDSAKEAVQQNTSSDNASSNNTSSSADSSGNNSSDTDSSDSEGTTPAADKYTVTFKDFDGTVLNTQTVEKGKGATAPATPKRENFKFAGWDKSFDNITADLTVTATYTTTKTVIYAERVEVNKGTDEVSVAIRVLNNPGIMGAVLKVSVDDNALSFVKAEKTEYPGLTLTSSGSKITSSPYTFVLDALELSKDDEKDGTLFTVTFKVSENAAKGRYNIELSYDKGAIFDKSYKDPNVCLENGSITVK